MNIQPDHQEVHTIRPMTQAEMDDWLLSELIGDDQDGDTMEGGEE